MLAQNALPWFLKMPHIIDLTHDSDSDQEYNRTDFTPDGEVTSTGGQLDVEDWDCDWVADVDAIVQAHYELQETRNRACTTTLVVVPPATPVSLQASPVPRAVMEACFVQWVMTRFCQLNQLVLRDGQHSVEADEDPRAEPRDCHSVHATVLRVTGLMIALAVACVGAVHGAKDIRMPVWQMELDGDWTLLFCE
jgi:hypothetical protein